jgi:hypothetical protein
MSGIVEFFLDITLRVIKKCRQIGCAGQLVVWLHARFSRSCRRCICRIHSTIRRIGKRGVVD